MLEWRYINNQPERPILFLVRFQLPNAGSLEETTAHMLQCSQITHTCSLDDVITFNDVGKQINYVYFFHTDLQQCAIRLAVFLKVFSK